MSQQLLRYSFEDTFQRGLELNNTVTPSHNHLKISLIWGDMGKLKVVTSNVVNLVCEKVFSLLRGLEEGYSFSGSYNKTLPPAPLQRGNPCTSNCRQYQLHYIKKRKISNFIKHVIR